MAASISIKVSPPSSRDSHPGSDTSWVTVLRTVDKPMHILSLDCLEAPSALELDEAAVPVLITDLLRNGWALLVEPREPAVVDGVLYRGFVLRRLATVGSACGEMWRLEVQVALGLEQPWDWASTRRLLDEFNALVRDAEISHE